MIGILAHVEKQGAAEAVRDVVAALERHGAPFLIEGATAGMAGLPGSMSALAVAESSELLVVLGGDGTILRVVHQLQSALPPVFGINTGSLGFLTCLGAHEIDLAVESILCGQYVLSRRALLRVEIHRANADVFTCDGLNEAVLSRGERSQLVKIHARIDGIPLTDYFADGLIVATPTGSTAYSLSSGGPILLPDSGSLVVTPICPHVLTNRSVVVSDGSEIRLEPAATGQDIFVNVDGQDNHRLGDGDHVIVRKSRRVLSLAMLPGRSFSEVLRQKLKWSGSNV